MTNTLKRTLPAIAIASALLLSGCGAADTAAKPESPLEKYTSMLSVYEEKTQADYDAENIKVEQLVAKCMVEEGFEYTPAPMKSSMMSYSSEDSDAGDFIEKYGYGIATGPWDEVNEETFEETPAQKANSQYYSSLSSSEQQAYDEAMYGPQTEMEASVSIDTDDFAAEEADGFSSTEYNWKENGCYGKASHETNPAMYGGEDPAQKMLDDPQFSDLFKAFEKLEYPDYSSKDPDIKNAVSKWKACMRDAGVTEFSLPDDIHEDLYEEWEALTQYDEETGESKEPSKAAKKKFVQREITLAKADQKCQTSSRLEETLTDAQNKLEQKFVDTHKTELDALVAKYGKKQKDKK